MNNQKYMCNYHFIAEAHDIEPHKDSKCSGITKEAASRGECCEAWKEIMLSQGMNANNLMNA